jgi:hypothetical protein
MINKLIRADYNSLIFEFRGYKVMIDFDLSKLYGVETKRLKEQVKRNISRFPKDFPRGASATMPSTRLPTTK